MRLPKQLASAMAQNGLLSPAILRYYPRKTAEELGLAPAQEVKMRKVLEGDITGIVFGTTIPSGHGGIVSIPKVDDGPMVCPGGFWSGASWRSQYVGGSLSRSAFLWSILVLPMTTTTTRTTRLPHLPLPLSSTGRFPHHHHSFTQPSPRSTARPAP